MQASTAEDLAKRRLKVVVDQGLANGKTQYEADDWKSSVESLTAALGAAEKLGVSKSKICRLFVALLLRMHLCHCPEIAEQ